jgi:hypothetical protein
LVEIQLPNKIHTIVKENVVTLLIQEPKQLYKMSTVISYVYADKEIGKPPALDKAIRQAASLPWTSDSYDGVSTNPLTVYVLRELTVEEKQALDDVIANYVDPSEFLIFNHTENCPMITAYSNSSKLAIVDGKKVMQNFIFPNQNQPNLVLDAIKTIVEYRCDDVTLFSQEPNDRQITVEIYDATRNVSITSIDVPLAEIADQWDQQAQSDPDSKGAAWRSIMFTGIHNKTTSYDCIWQLRLSSPNITFFVGLGSMQNIFYDVI